MLLVCFIVRMMAASSQGVTAAASPGRAWPCQAPTTCLPGCRQGCQGRGGPARRNHRVRAFLVRLFWAQVGVCPRRRPGRQLCRLREAENTHHDRYGNGHGHSSIQYDVHAAPAVGCNVTPCTGMGAPYSPGPGLSAPAVSAVRPPAGVLPASV